MFEPLPKKYRVTWWIHGAGRICRGSDIVEAEDEFDEEIAEDLVQEDLGNMMERATNSFKKNLPNFYAKHSELQIESRHSEISNGGILSVQIQPSQVNNRRQDKV